MARIRFDRKTCEGFIVCVGADPENFVEAEGEKKVDLTGGRSVRPDVWEKEIPGEGEALQLARSAAAGCPVNAIQVVDETGNVLEGPERLPIEEQPPTGAPGEGEPVAA